ncbi:MAG: PLP-dependent aminotransferase family protein [Oscillospiraceae bacterium]|nr:PLP-dependent aminotransferase family protein [Oscillospiraceae bacterium]
MEYQLANRVSSLKPSIIREILKNSSDPEMIPFSAGNPAPEAFPVEAIQEISARILKDNPILALQYNLTEGYTPLRNTLKQYMASHHNSFREEQDELIVTTGAQQVMDLATKVLCNEGDVVVCEAPTFIGSLNTFRSYNCVLKGVPMDEDGINLEQLDKTLTENPGAKLLYVIPNFQNPSGITMSLEKRKGVYALAKKHNIMILEDNPYGDLRVSGEHLPTIKSMDEDGIVIYAGTFSKVISSGMRVGFAIAPKPIMQKMVVGKQCSDVHTTVWSQIICDEFINHYDYDGHLQKLVEIYRKKSTLMLNAIDQHLVPLGITHTKVEGGLFVWCTLPDSIDMLTFCSEAVKRKVCVVPGSAFLTDESQPCQSFRMNFSTPTDENIVKGVETLGQLAKDMMA